MSGVIEKLICWENLGHWRFLLSNTKTGTEIVKFYSEEEKNLKENENSAHILPNFEVKRKESLIEWLIDNRKNFGSQLVLVSDKTPEGNQFVKGFGGLGGILRYSMEPS